jgi:hypothetical protein
MALGAYFVSALRSKSGSIWNLELMIRSYLRDEIRSTDTFLPVSLFLFVDASSLPTKGYSMTLHHALTRLAPSRRAF